MKLASRLSLFFLGAQAVVLVGFSFGLYWLVSYHLNQAVDDRLNLTLSTLSAGVEMERPGMEWEPEEREHALRRGGGLDSGQWFMLDEHNEPIDQSTDLETLRLAHGIPLEDDARLIDAEGRPWRCKTLVIRDPKRSAESPPTTPDRHSQLTAIAIEPLGATDAALRRLSRILISLAIGLWLLSAAVGRWLAQRAIAPLTTMATFASEADAEETNARLPVPATADELAEMGRAFNGLLDRLHLALERQRRFTGDASHQLRTPLAGLLSQVDVALRYDRSQEEYKRVLGLVHASAHELREIVESLLFLARTESESARPELQQLDLATWLPAHMQAWVAHARAHDIRTEIAAPPPLTARAHPALLAQLVDNLIENACKYSEPGTPVVVGLERDASFATLCVEDQGIGVAPSERQRIFEPFYRAAEATNRGKSGVGLGLAIVERIAQVFQGAIRVDSRPQGGTRFVLRLPLSAQQ